MFGIGMPEMILILVVALIVIGPKKLPDLAKSLGKALGEFKKATNDFKDSISMDSTLNDVKEEFKDLEKRVKHPLSSTTSTTNKKSQTGTDAQKEKPESGAAEAEQTDKKTESESQPPPKETEKTVTESTETDTPISDAPLETGEAPPDSTPVDPLAPEGQPKDA